MCLRTWAYLARATLYPPKYTGLLFLLEVKKIFSYLRNHPTAAGLPALSPPDVHHLCSLLFLVPRSFRKGLRLQFLYTLRPEGLQAMTAREPHLPRALSLASRQLSTCPVLQDSLWFLLRSLHSIFVTSLF